MPNEQKAMSSNLPLLFAKGRPRSLETISQNELEEFIHFMVLCSLKIEIANKPDDMNKLPLPQWWPEEVTFKFPLYENANPAEKKSLLKKLVCRCYTFYNCEFYLKFSAELAERASSEIRYQPNPQEKTMTILDADGCVLVKCRNENFCYDKRNTRRTQIIRTSELTSIPTLQITQPKTIAPLIDLTFESSGDETEVCFKEQTSFPTKRRRRKASVECTYQVTTRRRRLPLEEIAGTSKCPPIGPCLKKSPKKKRLLENYPKEDFQQNVVNKEPLPAKISKKRKRNVYLPITRKKRLFEDFPGEEREPVVLVKDGFMARLELAPLKNETMKLDHKIEGKRKLTQSFSLVTLTSTRGQALLARNDRFNMAASLDRNNRFCGTHQQEEEMNQMCTRSSNTSFFFKEDALIPENESAYAKGHIHWYKWPRRAQNVIYPQKDGVSPWTHPRGAQGEWLKPTQKADQRHKGCGSMHTQPQDKREQTKYFRNIKVKNVFYTFSKLENQTD